ncbi:histidine phosphatase family protein [Thalassotalea euphylliae]|uniref:histidine phosphatase family protein n=1 Tax=Thalassotalea euphylliae TaxID=1655234 RepID=UPI0036440E6C
MGSIYLVRHGQAGFGQQDYDILTEIGVSQAETLGHHFNARQLRAGRVISGTMTRHLLTKQHALSHWGDSVNGGESFTEQQHEGWNEFDHQNVLQVLDPAFADPEAMVAQFNQHQDKTLQFVKVFSSALKRWQSGDFDDEYNEAWHVFFTRVTDAFRQLCDELPAKENAVVFTSGGVIAALLVSLLNVPDENFMRINMNVANASVTEIKVSRFGAMLHRFNDYSAMELSGHHELVTFK